MLILAVNLVSCDVRVNRKLETKAEKMSILTIVETYSQSEKRFYGNIKICNRTADTIRFNFDQLLKTENELAKADYNFKPISYICWVFDIIPNECSTWEVIWQTKEEVKDFEHLSLIADTTVYPSCRKKMLRKSVENEK